MQHVFKARTAVARPNSNSNAWRPGNLNCTAWVSKAWRKVGQVQSVQFTNSSQFTTVFSHVYDSTKLIRMACWSKGRPVVPWWSIQTFRRPMLPPWWICKSCPGPNTLQAKFSEQMQKPCHLTKKNGSSNTNLETFNQYQPVLPPRDINMWVFRFCLSDLLATTQHLWIWDGCTPTSFCQNKNGVVSNF